MNDSEKAHGARRGPRLPNPEDPNVIRIMESMWLRDGIDFTQMAERFGIPDEYVDTEPASDDEEMTKFNRDIGAVRAEIREGLEGIEARDLSPQQLADRARELGVDHYLKRWAELSRRSYVRQWKQGSSDIMVLEPTVRLLKAADLL